MLGKLIKYDIKSTWRDFSAIYMSILLGVVIIPLVTTNINNNFINTTLGFVAFAIVIAVIAITIINLFKIFNINVFSREGYLTMTLPVNSSLIVTSKLIVSSMWITLTGIVSFIGLIILGLITSYDNLAESWRMFINILNYIDNNWILTITLMIIVLILSITKEVAKLFLSCSIAHLKQLNKFRVPAGILSYFAFSWIESLIAQGAFFIISVFSNKFEEIFETLENISSPLMIGPYMYIFNGLIFAVILYTIILIIGYSFSNVYLLNKKLDLD